MHRAVGPPLKGALLPRNRPETVHAEAIAALWLLPVASAVTLLFGMAAGYVVARACKAPHVRQVTGCIAVPNTTSIPLYVAAQLCVAKGGPLAGYDTSGDALGYIAL